jgi:hypothetical protein
MRDELFYSLYLLTENARAREKERKGKNQHASRNNFTYFTTTLLTLLGTHMRAHMCSAFVFSIALPFFSWIVNINIFFLVSRSLPTRLNASSGRGSQGVTVFAAALVALLLASLT